MPLPSLTPTPSGCRETSGRVEDLQVETSRLPRPLQARVYLPPCYADRPGSPYPLLLMLHGQSATKDQWPRLGLLRAADRLIAAGVLPPLLIALPYEQDNLSNPYESGYGDALVSDLLPWLEGHYNACRERSCRAIGGLSRGAAWAMDLGLAHWDVFSAIGAHSLAPFYGDYTKLPYLAREIPRDELPRIHMDSGKRDRYLSQARHYSELLTQNKLPHEYEEPEGEHDEAYWAKHVEEYLRWYGDALAGKNDGFPTPRP